MDNIIRFDLPGWVKDYVTTLPEIFENDQQKMAVAVELAQKNVENRTGGPFGAAIFDRNTNKIISVGVNLVQPHNCSILHAEIVAIMTAHNKLGCYSFELSQTLAAELFTSVEPCAMCLGAIGWSGLGRVVCGARDQDARDVGFDEGDKPQNWQYNLRKRGIDLEIDILRWQAREILVKYSQENGLIYNGRRENSE
ncbi:MAG: nucleoside deaminase [Phycisphaerae bacterium]|nr:nucleoside deaminase [Phycisphaerae bacterium]